MRNPIRSTGSIFGLFAGHGPQNEAETPKKRLTFIADSALMERQSTRVLVMI
jgi:hypothetical protein